MLTNITTIDGAIVAEKKKYKIKNKKNKINL